MKEKTNRDVFMMTPTAFGLDKGSQHAENMEIFSLALEDQRLSVRTLNDTGEHPEVTPASPRAKTPLPPVVEDNRSCLKDASNKKALCKSLSVSHGILNAHGHDASNGGVRHQNENIRRFRTAHLKNSESHGSCPNLTSKPSASISCDSSPNLSHSRRLRSVSSRADIVARCTFSPSAPTTPRATPPTTPKNLRRRVLTGAMDEDRSSLLSRSFSSNLIVRLRTHVDSSEKLNLSYPGTLQTAKLRAPALTRETHKMAPTADNHATERTQEHYGADDHLNSSHKNGTIDKNIATKNLPNGNTVDSESHEENVDELSDELDQELVEKCTHWLDGVEAAREDRCLEDVIRPHFLWR